MVRVMWVHSTEPFYRYINWEYCINNYEDIIKTCFDFPKIFIAVIESDYRVDSEKLNQLLDEYYPNPQNESEYYPILKLIEFCKKFPEFKDLIKHEVFKYPDSVALIFSRKPSHWGLRGDPYFWTYLEESFIEYSLPMDITYFEKLIKVKYMDISGKKIGERAFIKEFAHGGMSSGRVSGIWLNLIPLLKYRLIKLNNDYYLNNGESSKIIKNPKEVIEITYMDLDEILEEYDGPSWSEI